MLAPDPFLWSSSLKTRTQIIFPMDTSVIIMNLHIKSGSRVIESGIFCFFYWFDRYWKRCSLYSFCPMHLSRWTPLDLWIQQISCGGCQVFSLFFYIVYFCHRKEFKNNKLDSIITIAYRDVYADGLECKLEDVDNNKELYDRGKKVDAVFLDLPKPWCGILLFSVSIPIAIQSAFQCLRKGGRICCFSPCIEQVQKSCEMLREVGFDCMLFWVLGLPE